MKKMKFRDLMGRTKGDVVAMYGLESYDVALPQDWLDNAAMALEEVSGDEKAYYNLKWGTVWDYTDTFVGRPFYLYSELEEMMENLP